VRKHSKIIEDRLETIRSGCPNPQARSKRKFSRLILLADILLILMIFFYFNNRDDESTLSNSSVVIKGVNYRVSSLVNRGELIITTSLSSDNPQEIPFDKAIAEIFVSFRGVTILKLYSGSNESVVSMKKGATLNYFVSVTTDQLKRALTKNGIKIESQKRSFLPGSSSSVFQIRAVFLNAESVELELITEVDIDNE
jgi:hypothetical protein